MSGTARATTHGRKGRPWRRLREQVLTEEPVCYLCHRAPSTEVDHVVPLSVRPDLAHHRPNLRGACARCNGSKGARFLRRREEARRDWS